MSQGSLASVLIIALIIVGCVRASTQRASSDDIGVSKDNKLLKYFKGKYREKEVVKCASSDLNNDGTKDLVVIYSAGKEKKRMRVVLDFSRKYSCTNQVPAPVSKQRITFKDIDREPPVEFIVRGSRGSKVGFAIFKIKGTRLFDVFGQNMKDCCL